MPGLSTDLLIGLAAGVAAGVAASVLARATASSSPVGAAPTTSSTAAEKPSVRTPTSSSSSATPSATPVVCIEYCTGCRWMMRAAWMAQELLTTFKGQLGGVTLKPNSSRPGGAFEVTGKACSIVHVCTDRHPLCTDGRWVHPPHICHLGGGTRHTRGFVAIPCLSIIPPYQPMTSPSFQWTAL